MEIQIVTHQLSNAANAVFLIGMIIMAMFRLIDGRRENIFERLSLFLIMLGAFFLLLKAAHPSGTSFEILTLHSGVFFWLCSQAYRRYYKWFNELL